MSSRITRSQFEALKREAKRLKRASAMTHSQALDRVAKDNGFANWSLLAKAVDAPAAAPQQLPHEVRLTGFLKLYRGPTDVFHEYVPSKHPAKHYAGLRRGPYWQDFVGKDETEIRPAIAKLRRGIVFMDATELRPSKAWTRVFGRGARTEGFDHTSVWMDAHGRYLVTTEPYIGSGKAQTVLAWASRHSWRSALLPAGKGLWNPCNKTCPPGCAGHTEMVVLAPPKRAGDLNAVAAAVRALPTA